MPTTTRPRHGAPDASGWRLTRLAELEDGSPAHLYRHHDGRRVWVVDGICDDPDLAAVLKAQEAACRPSRVEQAAAWLLRQLLPNRRR